MTTQELEEIEKRSFNDLQTCLKHAEHLRDKWRADYARWKEAQRRETKTEPTLSGTINRPGT